MRSAIEISKYVIQYCKKKNYGISNLKLQKILYFIQADFLVTLGRPCFPEKIYAWDFGPVVPEVYREYKRFGASEIPGMVFTSDIDFDKKEIKIINDMIDDCAVYSASTLVDITHSQDPWKNAYYKKGKNTEITTKSMKKFFMEGENVNEI